jgi:hypothetical protein
VVVKHVLKYLRGTIHYGIRYTRDGGLLIYGFVIRTGLEKLILRRTHPNFVSNRGQG